MKIAQSIPTFGADTDNVPASEHRVEVPGARNFAVEMMRRQIAPDAIITQDTGEQVKCWAWGQHIIAYRGGLSGGAGWEVCAAYHNGVRPHMIPADLDLVLQEQLSGTMLDADR